MTSCPHLNNLSSLQSPKLSQSVHREECTQCFDNQDQPEGVDVCLSCFNGGCVGERAHARIHARKMGHKWTVNVRRRVKEGVTQRRSDDEPPLKMTKLAIVEENEEDKYEYTTTLKCWQCDPTNGLPIPSSSSPSPSSIAAAALINSILTSMSSARQSEVKSWEEEITPCEHTLTLEQLPSSPIPPSGLAKCASCDLTSNLWLCLTCGSLGCGRKQYGVDGTMTGNGHGLAHFNASRHPVSVKLGTITPEGNADIYCYVCDDAKLDPELGAHLATFGIDVGRQEKTVKSLTELQIEQNLKYDFSVTGEDGKVLESVCGPGLTGLANLGNSCYMASTLQTLFSLPPFQTRYFTHPASHAHAHAETCPEPLPASCIECQMLKIADGLLSGRYSVPSARTNTHTHSQSGGEGGGGGGQFQPGIKPTTFKSLIGKGHAEFATMKQQDAEEFLGHLLSVLRRDAKAKAKAKSRTDSDSDPTAIFTFAMEQRVQCERCGGVSYRTDEQDVVSLSIPAIVDEEGKDGEGKVRYRDVALWDCLRSLMLPEGVDDYACVGCGGAGGKTGATRQTRFATFPDVLVVHAKKFQLVNWVPAKLDIPVLLPPNDRLEFTEQHLGKGIQPGEEALPQGSNSAAGSTAPAAPRFNQDALNQLQLMGFSEVRAKKALLAVSREPEGQDAEAAMEWLFAHLEDPDIDEPIRMDVDVPAGAGAAGGGGRVEASAEQISMLADMGFTEAQAKKALRETDGNMERAVDWLFNHPEDTGEDTFDAAASSAGATQQQQPAKLKGSSDVPARYRLKAFISHKGPSVHSGHYVAHVRGPGLVGGGGGTASGSGSGVGGGVGENDWVLFNDEKVVKADEESVKELKKFAYLYVFEKVRV